jgi:hypothetical protein
MTDLETRLRAELNAAAHDVRTSPDAWQRNQRLLAAGRSGRRSRFTWLVSAAAAVVVVVAGFTALSGTGDNRSTPAESDPVENNGVLGTPVEVARLGSGPDQVTVEMAIETGKGSQPDMCTRFVTGPDSTSSCGGQSPDSEKARVAFDYLSGSQGAQTQSVQGVVDARVTVVRAWLSDGTEVRPRLVALGVDDLRGFAVPTKKGEPQPVRLAAYASDEKALEYVNVVVRFGAEWLPAGPVSGCPADVDCRLEKLDAGLIAQVIREPDRVIVLVWPEVGELEVSGSSAELRTGSSSGGEPGALIQAMVLTPATFGGPLDAQLTVTAVDGPNSVEITSPPP